MILSKNTSIPISLYLDVFSDNGSEDHLGNTANDTMGRLLLHVIGGKRGQKKKIPLRLIIDHIQSLGHSACPWGTGNVSSKEWLTYLTLEHLQDHFKIKRFDPENVAKLFQLSEFSRVATQLYESVNGTLMLKAGIQIVSDSYCWDPEKHKFYQSTDLDKSGWMPGSKEEPVTSDEIANAIIEDDPVTLQAISDRAGWKQDCHTRTGFKNVAIRLIKLFNFRYEAGADRDPVKDWDEAMSKGSRIIFAFGSGSNIQIQTIRPAPQGKVAQRTNQPAAPNGRGMCQVMKSN